MDKEIWKPIKGFENIYEISNKGRVKSLSRKTWNTKEEAINVVEEL